MLFATTTKAPNKGNEQQSNKNKSSEEAAVGTKYFSLIFLLKSIFMPETITHFMVIIYM